MGAQTRGGGSSGGGGGDVFLAGTQEFTGVNTFDLAPILGVDGVYGGSLKFRDLGGSGFTGSIGAPNLFTGNVSLTIPDTSGTWTVTGNDTHGTAVDAAAGRIGAWNLTAQSANITSKKFTNATPVGVYMVQAFMACTTAGAAGVNVTLGVAANDGVASRTTQTTLLLDSTTNFKSVTFPMRLGSGDVTWSTVRTGGTYTLYLRTTFLG